MKAFLISFALITFTTAATYAQDFHIGFKGGINMLKLTGRSFDEKYYPGFSAGFYGEYTINRSFGIQPELEWTQIVGNMGDQFNSIYPGAISTKVYNNYVALPILGVFKPSPEISILIGPQYGFLVNQTSGLYPGTNKDNGVFNKSDVSLLFGGQLNLNKVKLGIRYAVGLNNVNGINNSDTWRYHGFQFYLGYRLK